jgi:hypothetical protein
VNAAINLRVLAPRSYVSGISSTPVFRRLVLIILINLLLHFYF